MSEILLQAISAQRALLDQMNERALADIEWFKNGGAPDGVAQELNDIADSGESDGDGAEQQD